MSYRNFKIIMQWIKQRIERNKNCIIVINGGTGSGKSYSGLIAGFELSKIFGNNFSVENNVDFNFKNLLKKMQLKQNKGAGVPYIFEEVGAVGGGGASREWQSKANRFFNSFTQTSRHLNQILIFTCPLFTFLDAGTRPLVHMQWVTKGIDFKKKLCYLKPYVLQTNVSSGRTYFKYLRFRKDGIRYVIKQIAVPLPPPEILKEYENMKLEYTKSLNKSIIEAEEKSERKLKPKTKVDTNAVMFLRNSGLTSKEIAERYKVNIKTVQRHVKRYKNSLK